MKIIYLLGPLPIVLLLALSCQKEIDLKTQTPPKQLYVNCILNPDSIFRVFLSYSIPITAPTQEIKARLLETTDAVVLIKDDNMQIIDELNWNGLYVGDNAFIVFESYTNKRPLPNTTYHIEVTTPNLQKNRTITARTTTPLLPSPAPIRATNRINGMPMREIAGQDEVFKINLAWEDPRPQKKDLFILEAVYQNQAVNPTGVFASKAIRSELYSIHSENDNQKVGKQTDKFFYIFIDDEKMPMRTDPDSIRSKVGVLSNTFDQWKKEYGSSFLRSDIIIKIHHVNEDLYNYYKDVEKYRINTSGTDIFAQPVQVRGNVDGGLGIFGGEVIREIRLNYR